MRPSLETEGKLKSLITFASEKFQSERFVPHATLVGSVTHLDIYSILSICEKISSLGHRFDVEVKGVEVGQLFYRCVYARLRENNELLALRKTAMREFGLEESEQKPYMPHASIRE